MKKIFTILCLMALTLGAQAQTPLMEGYGNPLTLDQFKALVGTGQRFGFVASSNTAGDTAPRCDHWCGFTSTHNTTTLSDDYLFYLEASGDNYLVKRASDNQYVITNANSTSFGASGTPFKLVKRDPNDATKAVTGAQSISFEDPSNSAMHYNANAVKMNNGGGAWTTYAVFGPIYKNITIDCKQDGVSMDGYPQENAYQVGGTFNAPEFTGMKLADGEPTSVEINEDGMSFEFNYVSSVTYDITYRVVDEAGNELFTSPSFTVNGGTVITTLPAEYQQTLFYDYEEKNVTVNEDQTIDFTATVKSSAPFIPSTAASPVWYFLTLKTDANYVTYIADGEQNVQLPTTNADNETTHWAFIGNPYTGFTIVNEAAGTSLVLGSDATTGSANNGGNVYATLATEGSQTNEVWTVISSSYRTNGFFLQNTEGHRLNMRNGTANVSYWTGGADAGSTFVATKVPGLAELIPEAETLLSDLTAGADDVQIGYPTADALSTFSSAIDAAKDILNNGGDEATAIAALKAAMNAVRAFESINYTPRTDVYYTITSGRGSMVYDASHSGQVDSKYGNEFLWYSNSLDKTNANHQWGFIEVEGKYYMYNVGKRQFANVTQGGSYQGSNGDKHTWMFSNSPSSVTLDAGEGNWVVAPKVRVRATSEVTGKQYAMSISTSYVGPVIAYDAVNDGGIPMTFAIATTEQDDEVTAAIEALLNDPTPYKEALQEAINEANTFLTNLTNYPIGDGLNQYTMTGDTDALSSAVTAGGSELENADATKESLQAAIQAINEAKEAISLSLNMPHGKFIRIKAVSPGTYVGIGEIGQNTPHGDLANAAIFYVTEEGNLINYQVGNYMNNANHMPMLAAGATEPGVFTFGESNYDNKTLGAYRIHDGSSAVIAWTSGYMDRWGVGNHELCEFNLEEVTELPVTMNDGLDGKYYATFSAPVAISSITGATAHKVKVENEKAKYSETGVEGIPAGTGVLLINETGENATLTIGDFTETIDTDLQHIFAAESSHEGLFFGLSTESKLGFFKLMEGGETAPTTGGFKAYLDGSVTPTGAKGVELVADNEATGVDSLTPNPSPNGKGSMYNLQGQKVNKAQKGVFIQNGKKVVVK